MKQTNNDVYIYYNNEYYDLNIMQTIKHIDKIQD